MRSRVSGGRIVLQKRLRLLFFFSSRRRHTRFDCDWSSDVCSSDLPRSRTPSPARAAAASSCWARLAPSRSEEHTSELQSQSNLVCRLLLEKKKNNSMTWHTEMHYDRIRHGTVQ